jgi:hypothetical protein
MSLTRSIGKNTLGGGKKMQVDMRTYNRSTHDLSYVWRNTQSPGTLVPFICELALPGDVHEIQLSANVLTHPTVGPLFGSFKLQLDVFECPIRLYNAQLHNNKLGIGLDMSKVKFPVISVEYDKTTDNPLTIKGSLNDAQVNPSCLRSYLGFNGVGRIQPISGNNMQIKNQCMPELMYYDIFKNYYANLQEENAYYIDANTDVQEVSVDGQAYNPNNINAPIEATKEVELSVDNNIKPEDIRLTVQTFRGSIEKIEPKELGTVASDTGVISITITSTVYTTLLKVESTYGIGGGKLSTFKIAEVDLIREKILQAPTSVPYDLSTSAVELMTKFKNRTNNYLNTTFPQFGLCVSPYVT